MAVRFDATTDVLQRTTGLPSRTALTACGWAVRRVDTGFYSTLWTLYNAGGEAIGISTETNGDNLTAISHQAASASIITLTNDAWFFWALTAGASTLTGYAATIGNALSSQTLAQPGAFTPSKMEIGCLLDGSYLFNGSLAAVKIWDAVLTAEELEKERHQYLPNRLLNLHLFSPLINTGGTSFLDISGNGRNWTEGGAVTDEDGPPIPWKMGRHRILIPISAGVSDLSIEVNDSTKAEEIAPNFTGDLGGINAVDSIRAEEVIPIDVQLSGGVAIDQEGFRFRNDDGSEASATWKAGQDINTVFAPGDVARLRALLNATGDPASIEAQLEYRHKPSGGSFGDWKKVKKVD